MRDRIHSFGQLALRIVLTCTFAAVASAASAQAEVKLVFFTLEGCQPCQQMLPALGQLQSAGWKVEFVDASVRADLTQQLRVQNAPTILIWGPNGEIDRIVGVTSVDQIAKRASRAAARFGYEPSNRHDSSSSTMRVRGQSPAIAPILSGANELARNMGAVVPASLASPAPSSSNHNAPSSPASSSSLTPQQAVERAAAATVRIRVDEGNTTAHGTGTIVDVHGNEALVLTCGHLFRDMQPGSQLSLDLFAGSQREINLPAQLIDFRAENEDIGLISFRLPVPLEPVSLLPRGIGPEVGQAVFSFGCDHGQVPTRRDTRITNVNRYLGADNIEIGGAPAVGRSGGGLFDLQGRLIGVCNAACAEDDEGIYASASVIYNQIDRLGLGHLFQKAASTPRSQTMPGLSPQSPSNSNGLQLASSPTSPAPPNAIGSAAASPAALPGEAWPDEQTNNLPLAMTPSAGNRTAGAATVNSTDHSNLTGMANRDQLAAASSVDAAQLICVVRDAQGRDQVLTIKKPSAQLLQQLTSAAQGN